MNSNRLNIRLFTKSYCGWCHEALDWLRHRGLAFEELEVLSNLAAMEELQQLTGKSMTPTIEVNGQVLADFGIDELEPWWASHGFDG
ncbi:MAG: glutaredoxin family protein [Limisphaerales bacterium]